MATESVIVHLSDHSLSSQFLLYCICLTIPSIGSSCCIASVWPFPLFAVLVILHLSDHSLSSQFLLSSGICLTIPSLRSSCYRPSVWPFPLFAVLVILHPSDHSLSSQFLLSSICLTIPSLRSSCPRSKWNWVRTPPRWRLSTNEGLPRCARSCRRKARWGRWTRG